MKVLRDGNIWFMMGGLLLVMAFIVASYGASSLVSALFIGLSIVANGIGLVLNAQNAKANRS